MKYKFMISGLSCFLLFSVALAAPLKKKKVSNVQSKEFGVGVGIGYGFLNGGIGFAELLGDYRIKDEPYSLRASLYYNFNGKLGISGEGHYNTLLTEANVFAPGNLYGYGGLGLTLHQFPPYLLIPLGVDLLYHRSPLGLGFQLLPQVELESGFKTQISVLMNGTYYF
ncbi:MAG: hypothetical protein HYW85_07190 [Deltaproteobacteria bacterium]|nr:hypothetical protein [Deltaproteobacteria bacterium]